MEDLETLPDEPDRLPPPPLPRRRRGGGMSTESFLASLLLHLAALFLVILYAPDRPSREHDTVLLNIGEFVLPESPAPAVPEAQEAPAAAETPPAPVADGAVQVPARDVPVKPEAPVKPPEDPAPQAAKAETPKADAARPPAGPPTPPVPESSLPHQHGEYDPFEIYKAALAERVNEVLVAALNDYPILRAFRGKLVVHLYLDQQGRLRWFNDQAGLFIRGAAICLHHRGYQIQSIMPMPAEVFRRHCDALDQYVVKAINDGAPYPAPPPGLDIDSYGELSYVFELPDQPSQGVRPANVPRVSTPVTAGPPQG